MSEKEDKYDGEQVLVVDRRQIEAYGHALQGIIWNPERGYSRAADTARFALRADAEEDPSLKQVIPYCFLKDEDEKIFCYKRTKLVGEERLEGKRSIGIGGHINPCDDPGLGLSSNVIIDNAIKRELREEVDFGDAKFRSFWPYAIINDDWDDVGRVHLGIVGRISILDEIKIKLKDPALIEGQWMTIEQLWQGRNQLERWSQLLVTGLRW